MSTAAAAPLNVELAPRDIVCTANLAFAAEYPILNCTFEYAEKYASVHALSSRIDDFMRVKDRGQVVDLGPLEFFFVRRWRVQELALTISPDDWRRDRLDPEPLNAPEVFMSFNVDFDLDGRFTSRLEAHATYDNSSRQLEIRMLPAISSVIWHRLADRVLVMSSASGQFAGLRLLGLEAVPK